MLTRRAAEFIGVEEIQALERINAEMQDAVGADRRQALPQRQPVFHFALYGAANSA